MALNKLQLDSWYNDGFIIVKNVLNQEQVNAVLSATDEIIIRQKNSNKNTSPYHGKKYFNIHNPMEYTNIFDFLIDYKTTFEIALQLMGPYIQVMGCHIFVRHPNNSYSSNITKFHTDSGPSLQQILPYRDNPALQLKFQFFLTDILQENSSNFILIPGSHMDRVKYTNDFCLISECNQYLEQGKLPPGAIQIKAKAGDVLIHTLTLKHAVALNLTSETRRSISIRYGQMWFKNYHFAPSKSVMQRISPKQRRLLGDMGEEAHRGDVAYRPPANHLDLMYKF